MSVSNPNFRLVPAWVDLCPENVATIITFARRVGSVPERLKTLERKTLRKKFICIKKLSATLAISAQKKNLDGVQVEQSTQKSAKIRTNYDGKNCYFIFRTRKNIRITKE